jgi:hypothetical protein
MATKAKAMVPVVSVNNPLEGLTDDFKRDLEQAPAIKEAVMLGATQTDIVDRIKKLSPASSSVHVFKNPALEIPEAEVFTNKDLLKHSIYIAWNTYAPLLELRLVCGPSFEYISAPYSLKNPTNLNKSEVSDLIATLIMNNPKAIGFKLRQESKTVGGSSSPVWFWTLEIFNATGNNTRDSLIEEFKQQELSCKKELDKLWAEKSTELESLASPQAVYGALKRSVYSKCKWNPAYYAVQEKTD